MTPIDLSRVSIEVRNDCPQVGQHARLLLVGLLNFVSLAQDLLVLGREELCVLFPHNQFLKTVDQLVLLGHFVLGLHHRVQNV